MDKAVAKQAAAQLITHYSHTDCENELEHDPLPWRTCRCA